MNKDERTVVEAEAVETVSKADYDVLAKEYQRVQAAYNKLLTIVANEYADKLTKAIFEEVDTNLGR